MRHARSCQLGAKTVHCGRPLRTGTGVELLAHERFVDAGEAEGLGRVTRSRERAEEAERRRLRSVSPHCSKSDAPGM
jgi:hypothetical protein